MDQTNLIKLHKKKHKFRPGQIVVPVVNAGENFPISFVSDESRLNYWWAGHNEVMLILGYDEDSSLKPSYILFSSKGLVSVLEPWITSIS